MVENVTQIKIRIMINVGMIAKIQKNIIDVKKIIFGMLLFAVLKMLNIQQVLLMIWWLHVMKF